MNNSEINLQEVNLKISEIFKTLSALDKNIEKINKKISVVNKLYFKLSSNKTLVLKNTNSFLRFQIDLLKNQKSYYTNLKNIVFNKFCNQLYDISEYIIISVSSLENLEIENVSDKNSIIKKLIYFKKGKNDTSKIVELTNITLNNLSLIKEFIDLFDKYIKSRTLKNKKDNIHSNNFELDLDIKKNVISLEYKKYNKKIIELIDYFSDCCKAIDTQIKNKSIMNFILDP